MAIHHYLVEYDTDKKRWDWSATTEQARFGEQTIYADENWVSYEHDSYKANDESINKRLALGLRFLNYCNDEMGEASAIRG